MIETTNINLDQSEKMKLIFDGLNKNKELMDKINHHQKSITFSLKDIDKSITEPEKSENLSLTSDIDRLDKFLDRVFSQMELVSIMLKNTKEDTTRLYMLTHDLDGLQCSWVTKESLKYHLEDKE